MYRTVSSVYSSVFKFSTEFGASFIKERKSSGLRAEPWGTPQRTVSTSESLPLAMVFEPYY